MVTCNYQIKSIKLKKLNNILFEQQVTIEFVFPYKF